MIRFHDYILLHLNIMLFSFTGIFSKLASGAYNAGGPSNPMVYVFLMLMLLNCGIYAIAWQRIMKKFDLSIAFANRSVYLIWAQIWAVLIFKETLTLRNIIGMFVVLVGVSVVQISSAGEQKKQEAGK